MDSDHGRWWMMKKANAAAIIVAALILLCFTGCGRDGLAVKAEAETGPAEASVENAEAVGTPPVQLSIVCAGDVMVHKSQIPSQYDAETGTYDYDSNFAYVKKYIENSDLALCNLETTFGGKPYTGYPAFSAPDELAAALKTAGFDAAMTANNHMLDKGLTGLKRTLDVLRQNGLVTEGSRDDPGQPRYAMFDVKGVKIGLVAYTYATSSSSGAILINGSAVSKEAAELVNYFRYDHLDEDLNGVKETVDAARAAGADIIIAYYHWGEEYQLQSNEIQRYIAEKTVKDMNVDMIFASHPHTLQESVFITDDKTGMRAPVFYSLGNFISNQRTETLSNRYTEVGAIGRVDVTYDMEKKAITAIDSSALPVWVEKYKSGGRDVYAVIPLDDSLGANEALLASGHLARAEKALEDANGILKMD